MNNNRHDARITSTIPTILWGFFMNRFKFGTAIFFMFFSILMTQSALGQPAPGPTPPGENPCPGHAQGIHSHECENCTGNGTCWDCVNGKKVKRTGSIPGEVCKRCDNGKVVSLNDCATGNPCKTCVNGAVTDVSLELTSTMMKICKSEQSYTVSLKESSIVCLGVSWTGPAGPQTGSSYTFNPSVLPDGSYTITATPDGCPAKSVSATFYVGSWDCEKKGEDITQVNLALTAAQIISSNSLDNVLLDASVSLTNLKSAISDLITPAKENELKARHLIEAPGQLFADWLTEKINLGSAPMATAITTKISETITPAIITAKMNTFATSFANELNEICSFELKTNAIYKAKCNAFDPGTPGWSDPTLLAPTFQDMSAEVELGYEASITGSIAVVTVSLPSKAKFRVYGSASFEGFHGTADPWDPTRNQPGPVTSKFQLLIKRYVKSSVNMSLFIVASGSIDSTANIILPTTATKYPITMNAAACDKVLPWTP